MGVVSIFSSTSLQKKYIFPQMSVWANCHELVAYTTVYDLNLIWTNVIFLYTLFDSQRAPVEETQNTLTELNLIFSKKGITYNKQSSMHAIQRTMLQQTLNMHNQVCTYQYGHWGLQRLEGSRWPLSSSCLALGSTAGTTFHWGTAAGSGCSLPPLKGPHLHPHSVWSLTGRQKHTAT